MIVSQVRIDAYVQAVNDVFVVATLLTVRVLSCPYFLLRTKKAFTLPRMRRAGRESHRRTLIMRRR